MKIELNRLHNRLDGGLWCVIHSLSFVQKLGEKKSGIDMWIFIWKNIGCIFARRFSFII